jgi:hypothetical protein
MKILKTLASMLVLIFLIGMLSGTAMAGAPPVVPQKPVPPTGGGGGGGSPSYSEPEPFHSSTVTLSSSDGSAVGNLTSIDFYTVRLNAAGNGMVNGKNHSVAVTADLNSMPSSPVMDIKMGSEGNIPGGMDGLAFLSAVDITGQGLSGWSLKSGTTHITFSVPSSMVTAGTEAKLYIVYYDGANYHFITANVAAANGVTTIDAAVPGIAGTFTAVMSGCPTPTPAPTASPTPAPTPVPTPEPTPAPSGLMGIWSSLWISTFGTFAIGEAAGAVMLLFLSRFWK